MRARWAVLISGRGSNLSALLDHPEDIPVVVVISSKSSAEGIAKARRAGVPTLVLDKKIDWTKLSDELRRLRVTHVCLAGFMRIVPLVFVNEWRGQMINLHPSLLPKYPGLESIAFAHAAGDEIGVTVHEVDEGVDTGKLILQRRSLCASEARETDVAQAEFRVHVTEQKLLVRAAGALSDLYRTRTERKPA